MAVMMLVSELSIYPLKSASGIHLERAEVGARGFAHDRRWMLVDRDGQFLTQREHPELALVATSMSGDSLVFEGAAGEELEVPLCLQDGQAMDVEVWRSACSALRAGEEADAWFGELLGIDCRLVFMPDSTRRRVNQAHGSEDDIVSFADGYPFLLIGQASLDDLNRRLDQPVPMDRFRPNIVVDTDEPFVEDTWRRVRIGEVEFRVAKPCARCVVTTTDQKTAKRGKEPLKTLATYRRIDGEVLFGQNLIQEGRGEVGVGDPVEVLEFGE
jgi:uncharacterized protein YcbX